MVSDKHLTENCGLLNKLIPGDVVLANRGFDIADSVGFYQATLKIPAFTRGKRQLSAHDIQETKKLQMFAYMSRELLVSLGESM